MKVYDVMLHDVPEDVLVAANKVANYARLQGWDRDWAFGPVMSRNNGLKFIQTRAFHDMSYNFDEKAEDAAKKRGQVVVYPGPNEIQIDIDSEDQKEDVLERIQRMVEMDVLPAFLKAGLKKSKTEGHYHLTMDVGEPIDEWKRIALQCVLGSDPTREFLNCMRMLAGATEKATRLFETPPETPVLPQSAPDPISLAAMASVALSQSPELPHPEDALACAQCKGVGVMLGELCAKCGGTGFEPTVPEIPQKATPDMFAPAPIGKEPCEECRVRTDPFCMTPGCVNYMPY